MSIKHIYEHLLEHFICLKSFITTVKFSCYVLWAKSRSSFHLNSHWLQQEADLIVCGFPYKFNIALNKMGSTILDRKSQCLAGLNKPSELSLQRELNNKQINLPHTHKSVNLHIVLQKFTDSKAEHSSHTGIPSTKACGLPHLGGTFYHQLLPLRSLTDAPITKTFVLLIKATKGQNPAMSASISSSDTSRQSWPPATPQESLEQSAQSQKVNLGNSPRKVLQRKPCQKSDCSEDALYNSFSLTALPSLLRCL